MAENAGPAGSCRFQLKNLKIRTNPAESNQKILEMDARCGVTALHAPRFDLDDAVQAQEMVKYLEENGYAVVSSVASHEEIDVAKGQFWDFAEKYCTGLKRGDATTWHDDRWLANPKTGIISGCGFNHSDFLWSTRMLPKVRRAFELIWGVDSEHGRDRMLVSFDGGNAFRPWRLNPTWATDGGWWHVDQNSRRGPHRKGRVCVQGLVTYYDADADTGGLCVVPQSHHEHDGLCARIDAARLGIDFVQVPEADPVLANGGVLVCAKAGDLLLWDSRTVHCNTPSLNWSPHPPDAAPPDELIRLVAYVCMLPRSRVPAEMLPRRQAAFENQLPTAHWPDVAPPLPPTNRRVRDPNGCPREMLDLVGYPPADTSAARPGCAIL